MSEDYSLKAEPQVMDTGTFYVESKFCVHCNQSIERVAERDLLDDLKVPIHGGVPPAVTWFHSDTMSAYCYGQGDR